ncbi:protein FAM83C-like [Silurus asotus]|uniref:Protein FAM83C-like n=1 Tax=Silurus asotus TaxID=30991 RepID=A0AAD5FMW5_SILAS|nr:protein FAM83C-like [Silurus asotus]
MSNSQEQSLNENVVFLPARESNPDFFHSEVERNTLDSLLRDGPEAFYDKLKKHQLKPFLSPEEVKQISRWVEDHPVEVVENGDAGNESSSDVQGFSDEYFPEFSDTPAPCLELGWPEKFRWDGVDQAMVYTNPPVEQAPHIREVIRRLLQEATMLIAIAADRITDITVIRDLLSAASRGIIVYIILNRRPAQDNLTPNQLRHPNIIVRILGGKKFISKHRKMVVGELKENFVLVDLETVVVGSYSLTWTDAHLHRQLVTVLNGPVVELFDREFRILYAASLPVPDSWKAARPAELPKIEKTVFQPEPTSHKQTLLDCPPSPPPPTTDSPIDWNALGVFQKIEDSLEDQELPKFSEELPKIHRTGRDWHTESPGSSLLDLHITEWPDESRNTQRPERLPYGFLAERDDRPAMFRHQNFRMERSHMEDFTPLSHAYRRESLPNLDRSWMENTILEEMTPGSAAAPVHRKKPLIVSVPQTDSSWPLGDILKKNFDYSTNNLQTKIGNSIISKSSLDLSSPATETLNRSQSQANTLGVMWLLLTLTLCVSLSLGYEVKRGCDEWTFDSSNTRNSCCSRCKAGGCRPCPAGTFNSQLHHQCVKWNSSCPSADQQIVAAGTAVSNIVCADIKPTENPQKFYSNDSYPGTTVFIAIMCACLIISTAMLLLCVSMHFLKDKMVKTPPEPQKTETAGRRLVPEPEQCTFCFPQEESGSNSSLLMDDKPFELVV